MGSTADHEAAIREGAALPGPASRTVPVSAADPLRYQMLVEAIDDYVIFMLDPDGRIASWNPGAQRFKGYTAAEIIGEHFSRFYTPEDVATNLPGRALAHASRTGRFEQEGWRVRKSGERFWAHVVIDPIRSSEGPWATSPERASDWRGVSPRV